MSGMDPEIEEGGHGVEVGGHVYNMQFAVDVGHSTLGGSGSIPYSARFSRV